MRKSKKNRMTKNKTKKNISKCVYTDETRRLIKLIKQINSDNKKKNKTSKRK
jgi:hypothetical protein